MVQRECLNSLNKATKNKSVGSSLAVNIDQFDWSVTNLSPFQLSLKMDYLIVAFKLAILSF